MLVQEIIAHVQRLGHCLSAVQELCPILSELAEIQFGAAVLHRKRAQALCSRLLLIAEMMEDPSGEC
jgi:hypothetical protein